MSAKVRCPKCKEPLDECDIDVHLVTDTAVEFKFDCLECMEVFSCWVPHKGGWSDSEGNPVDITVAKPEPLKPLVARSVKKGRR